MITRNENRPGDIFGFEGPVIIAELSGNHNGSLDRALELIDAAAAAGASAVKLQTYTADTMTLDSDRPGFRIENSGTPWDGWSLYDLYDAAHTPWEWHADLFERARGQGMVAFSSPFDAGAVDFLEELEVPLYKIASFENGDHALLRRVAGTGKPVILSTGTATLEELDQSVAVLREAGCSNPILLKCTSSYPADPADCNLRAIPVLRERFGCEIGLSDHTPGIGVAAAGIALGVRLIEKHLTLSRADGGVDADFSLEPFELAQLVEETRRAWQALGTPDTGPAASERGARQFRRSLYVVKDVRAGEPLDEHNVRSIRPGHGLAPKHLDEVLGRKFNRDVPRGTPLDWTLLDS